MDPELLDQFAEDILQTWKAIQDQVCIYLFVSFIYVIVFKCDVLAQTCTVAFQSEIA